MKHWSLWLRRFSLVCNCELLSDLHSAHFSRCWPGSELGSPHYSLYCTVHSTVPITLYTASLISDGWILESCNRPQLGFSPGLATSSHPTLSPISQLSHRRRAESVPSVSIKQKRNLWNKILQILTDLFSKVFFANNVFVLLTSTYFNCHSLLQINSTKSKCTDQHVPVN